MKRRMATHLRPGPSSLYRRLRTVALTSAVVALIALLQVAVIGAAGPALTFVEFEKDGVGDVDGLDGAHSVTVSPDGSHLYAASAIDSAVAVFSVASVAATVPGVSQWGLIGMAVTMAALLLWRRRRAVGRPGS